MNELEPEDRPIVRARRFEVVDEAGSVVATLGEIGRHGPQEAVVGLSVVGRDGLPSVSLGVGAEGAWLTFELGGNILATIGVNGPSVTEASRVYLALCDRSGAPVVGWRIGDDGTVESEGA